MCVSSSSGLNSRKSFNLLKYYGFLQKSVKCFLLTEVYLSSLKWGILTDKMPTCWSWVVKVSLTFIWLCLHLCFAVPSTPGNPRIFVLPSERSLTKDEVIVEFRWDKPKHENGVLTRSEIFYHISNHSDAGRASKGWIAVNVSSSVTSFQLKAMSPGYTVAFQVWVKTGIWESYQLLMKGY